MTQFLTRRQFDIFQKFLFSLIQLEFFEIGNAQGLGRS